MSQQIQSSYIGQEVFNGQRPVKGSRIVRLDLDFSIQAEYDINLTSMQENDRIEFIQGAYVDNSANTASFTLLNRRTGQKVIWPPFSFGWATIFCPNQPKLQANTTTTGIITLQLTSFPVANDIVQTGPAGSLAPVVQVIEPANILAGQAAIAVTGTAVALPVNTLVNGVTVKADRGNTDPISIGPTAVNNTVGGTGTGFMLYPGDSLNIGISTLSNVFINGTAGDYISWAAN